MTADPLVQVDDSLKKHIVHSCYLSLVQLGDLSRYRESEIPKKNPDWGPAKGYYELAIALDPTWGTSYNQLAVIALKDQDHLRAVYYLYRAISVENPFPQAPNNLELEFKKIRARALQGKPISPNNTEEDGTLCDLFLVFHASCADITFVSDEVQLDEMLQRFGDHLKERPSDSNTRKLCLINIAAEEVVAQKIRGRSRSPFTSKILTVLKLAAQRFNHSGICNSSTSALFSCSYGSYSMNIKSEDVPRTLPHRLRNLSSLLHSLVESFLTFASIAVGS